MAMVSHCVNSNFLITLVAEEQVSSSSCGGERLESLNPEGPDLNRQTQQVPVSQ